MALSGILPVGPQPAASGRFYAEPVQDLTALRVFGPPDRADKMVRRVEDSGAFYAWDEQSVAVDDGDLFILPNDSPATGRWLKDVPAGGLPGSHNTTHENLGGDEINVAGLSGELADPQPPKAHTHVGAEVTDFDATVTSSTHAGRVDNPHTVTAAQAGAAPLVHTHVAADVTDFDAGVSASTHAGLTSNPHGVTAAQAGAVAVGAAAGGDLRGTYPNPTIETIGRLFWVATTDDLVAMLAAAAAGDIYWLLPGDHTLTGTLAIPALDNLTIKGERGARIVGENNVANNAMITVASGADGLMVEGLRLEPQTNDTHGIHFLGAHVGCAVRRCRFEKGGAAAIGNCIHVTGTDVTVSRLWIEKNEFEGSDWANHVNFDMTETTTAVLQDVWISDNRFQNPGTSCVRFDATGTTAYTRIHIQRNIMNAGVNCLQFLEEIKVFTIKGNLFTNTGTAINSTNGSFIDGTIEGNVFEDPSVAAILMGGGDQVDISDNRFLGCPTAFDTNGSYHNGNFEGNTITGGGATGFGVEHTAGDNTVYANNTIIGLSTLQRGIQVAGGADVLIQGNNISELTNTSASFCIEQKGATRGSITANFCSGSASAPAVKTTVPGATITANNIVGGSKNIEADLSATAGAEGPIIEGNTCRSAGSVGIHVIGNGTTHIDGFTVSRNKVFGAGTNSVQIEEADQGDVDMNRLADGGGHGLSLTDVEKTAFMANRVFDHAVAAKLAISEDSASDDNEYAHTFSRGNTGNYSFAGTNQTEVFNNPNA